MRECGKRSRVVRIPGKDKGAREISFAMDGVISTLSDLVSINSVNPEWNGPGERKVSEYVSGFFRDAGIIVEIDEVLPGRSNVIACVKGLSAADPVLFEAHMDTVSVDGMTIPPFEPLVSNGKLYGRGSCDTKAALAAMMHAVRDVALSGEEPPRDIIFAAVVDEEHAFRGVLGLIEWLKRNEILPGAAVVAEPTELRLVRANKGVLRWRIETRGKASHSSKPHLGDNAIVRMSEVIRELEEQNELMKENSHPLLGSGTCCISMIEGGEQVNFVPSRCTIHLDRRLLPGESVTHILSEYRKSFSKYPEGTVDVLSPDLADEAMETPVSEAVVQVGMSVLEEMKLESEPCGVPFGCDVTKLSRFGIPGVIFGPGSIDQAHADVEYVDVNEVEMAFDFYRRFLLNYGL